MNFLRLAQGKPLAYERGGGSDEELKSFLALGERLYFDLEAIQKFIEKGLT